MTQNVFSNSARISHDQGYLKKDCLHRLLEESLKKPVVLVVAGIGYGKTETVYSFLQEYDAKTIWQQLTTLDNMSMRFWGNFVNIVSLTNRMLASKLEILGFPETAAKFDMLISYLLEELNHDKKYVLVYDDFHLINEKKVRLFVEKLVNTYIHNLTIVLISRAEPEINTSGILAKGRLSSINEKDLRFSKKDIIRYFEMQKLHVSSQTISRIYNDTDGWIMAIRLVEISIKKGAAHQTYALSSMQQNIFKLIENDIYSAVSEDVQMFLIKLSLFINLPLGLVRLLAADNEWLISSISKINSFVRYDSFLNTYCIHNMFLDFLLQKQNALTQNEKAECYLKAADWYA